MEFTELEMNVIRSLQEGIMPATTTTPGAKDLPVAEIFAAIASAWETDDFVATASALNLINDISLSISSLPVAELDAPSLASLVDMIANQADFASFWGPFRMLSTLSYYGLPPAYLAIGLPGPTIDKGGLTPEGYPA